MSVSIKKTGIVQASGEIGRNLFAGSSYSPYDISKFGTNGTTDWTRFLCYYNGNASLHKFSDLTDTITLSAGGNVGIAFARLATDIDLDPTSYYTISCEAKCTKADAHLDIGLSYLKTTDAWSWRGGTGSQNFTAVNTWQKFIRTFKPDSDTKAINYCFTVIGTSGGTDTFSIRHCKLEKGSIPTDWCPAIEDEYFVSSTSGFNELFDGNASISKGYINSIDFIEI